MEIEFVTSAPINQAKLSGQNRLVFDVLSSGKTLTCFQAQELNITALNSRISDLRNKHQIIIYDRMIKTSGGSHVKEYSLTPFSKA